MYEAQHLEERAHFVAVDQAAQPRSDRGGDLGRGPAQQLLGISVALNVSFLEFSKAIGDAGKKAIDQLNADYIAASTSHKPLLDRRDSIKIELQTLEADRLSMRARVSLS